MKVGAQTLAFGASTSLVKIAVTTLVANKNIEVRQTVCGDPSWSKFGSATVGSNQVRLPQLSPHDGQQKSR